MTALNADAPIVTTDEGIVNPSGIVTVAVVPSIIVWDFPTWITVYINVLLDCGSIKSFGVKSLAVLVKISCENVGRVLVETTEWIAIFVEAIILAFSASVLNPLTSIK